MFTTRTGSTPPKADASLFGTFMPLVKPPELLDGPLDSAEDGLSECGVRSARTLPTESVLVSCIGNLGKVGLNTVPVAFNQQINAVLPDRTSAIPEFMFYQALSPAFRAQLELLATGTTVRIVNKSKFNEIEIVLAPLSEQQRIVAILDEAFEGIATAKANADKNLQNVRELFESALDAALSRHGGGFTETTLGDEIDLVAGYAFASKGYTDDANGIRLLRGDNIMQGYLRWDDAKGWPAADVAPYARFALQEGDVVLAMDRPWVKAGLKRAQIGADDLPCLQLQRTARLRPRRRMSEGFLYHLIGSKSFSRHLLSVQTGLGVPHISGKQIESFRFMLPPPNEQGTAAGTLDDLQQCSERLEEVYRQKASALDELKKALLHQAFTGALTNRSAEKQVADVA